jgi:hypothetical protein
MYLVQFEKLLRCVRQLTQCQRWVDVYLLAKRPHNLLSVVSVRENTRGWDKSMHSVANCSYQYPAGRQK